MLGESGGSANTLSAALLAWGGGVARFLAEIDADDLDDLIVTSRRSYHLVRQVGSGPSDRILVYLCLDRARGNLAAARRELGSTRLHDRLTAGGRPGAQRALFPARALPPAAEPVPAGAVRPSAPPAAAARTGAGPVAEPPPSVVGPVPGAHDPPAVPRQRTAMAALPRRSAAPPPPPPAAAPAGPLTVPPGLPESGLAWANDAATLRRLLAALRRMT